MYFPLKHHSQCHLSLCASKRKRGKTVKNSALDCIGASCRAVALLETLPEKYDKVPELLAKAWYRTAAGALEALGELVKV
jgi:hypothetical protein